MTDLSVSLQTLAEYRPTHKVRFITAAALFDGHDAAINIMRSILQSRGAEVIHLGHNRSVDEIVTAALQEDVQAIAVSSYQGGHVEFFQYIVDQLKARDGFIAIICNNNRHFFALLKAMGRDELQDDPRFCDLKSRIRHINEVDALVGALTVQFDRQQLVTLLLSHRVPHAPVRDMVEVINDPNMHERGSLQWIEYPGFGRVVVQHSPIRVDGIPLMPLQPSSRLGEQNAHVYQDWLGLSKAEYDQLSSEKII